MSVDPRHVTAVLFEALGLGQPPAQPTEPESFEVEDARCIISRAPSGTEVLLALDIGTLTREPYAGADRLRRLLQFALGLAVVNRAALVCNTPLNDTDLRALQSGLETAPTLHFSAVSRIESARRDEIISALQDVLQLRTVALQYLARPDSDMSDDTSLPPPSSRTSPLDDDGGAFLIFQP